ncbi:MAG: thiamine-phosphate kinase [Candidatus Bathyarchaeia archaeon]
MAARKGLGEREIIATIRRLLGKIPKLELPFGDDVVAFRLEGNSVGVLKTDMLVAKTDVPPGMTVRQAARKALVMCVSDFAAKGVKPLLSLVALGIPSKMTESEVRALALGLREAARGYGFWIVGGDTNEADDLVISPILYGISKRGQILPRGGAKPGDSVVVSGTFGNTKAGLKILLEGYEAPLNLKRHLLRAVYLPEARLSLGLKLKDLGATAAIDSSDGLAWSLNELALASGVGFEIQKLPVADEAATFAKLNQLDIFDLVFYGGEEYEIVATMPPNCLAEAEKELGGRIIKIGCVTRKKGLVFNDGETRREIKARGWEHFRAS